MEFAIKIFAVILMMPIFAIGFLTLIRFMVMKEMDVLPGIVCLLLLTLLMTIGILTPSPWVSSFILLGLVTLMVFFPFAQNQMAHLELRVWNDSVLERAHEAISTNPGNISAYFALAEALYERGQFGSGIALAEATINGLSTEVDPARQSSMRLLFRAEEARLRRWQQDHGNSRQLNQPLRCPLCGAQNAPGTLACSGCRKPYLLEIVRRSTTRGGFIARLCLGWSLLALIFGLVALAGFTLTGPLLGVSILGGVVVIGFVLYLLFGRNFEVRKSQGPSAW